MRTMTLVLGDVEGPARKWATASDAAALAMHRLDAVLGEIAARHGGIRSAGQIEGHGFVLGFERPHAAVAVALDLQRRVTKEACFDEVAVSLRVAVHTGDVELRSGVECVGPALDRCTRLLALGHGGQTLLSQATADLVLGRLPDGSTLRDLGRHHLRDLSRHERVFQLCHSDVRNDFPSLRSLDVLPNNLPIPTTSFLGRRAELARVRSLSLESALLTLTGAGGCGKTRIALRAAAEMVEDFPDGVWWVDLAPVADPLLIGATFAAALSAPEPIGDGFDELIGWLRQRRLLAVLDNCEHLIDACADVATAILAGCPSVSILATSREPLGVPGEITFRVPSLGLPRDDVASSEAALGSDAVALFAERARAVRPSFRITDDNADAVAEIVRRLDGIPLAIELAAARIRILSPQQIARGLSDRFHLLTGGSRQLLPRQRTLEASVDWSYALLAEPERMLLARLSVFAGGFDLEAAEHLGGDATIGRYEVLDLLSGLVDRSLVQADDHGAHVRYRMLETIRVYARERLDDAAGVRDRHLDYYIGVAERRDDAQGADVADVLARLAAERDNFHVAMDWGIASGQPDKTLRLAAAASPLWLVRGSWRELLRRVEAGVATEGVGDDVRARALLTAATMAGWWDFRAMHNYAEQAAELGRRIGKKARVARAVGLQGYAALCMDMESASRHAEEATELAREVEFHDAFGFALMVRFHVELNDSVPAARETGEAAIAVARREGNPFSTQLTLAHFARNVVLLGEGRLDEATAMFDEVLAIGRPLGDVANGSIVLSSYVLAELLRGKYDHARELAGQAEQVAARSGFPPGVANSRLGRGLLDYAVGDLDRARVGLDEARMLWQQTGNVPERRLCEWGLGMVALRLGDREASRMLLTDVATSVRLHPFTRTRTQLGLAAIARQEGDLSGAEALAHDALELASRGGERPGVVDALEALAGIAAELDRPEEAARLAGAAAAIRRSVGYVRFPVDREVVDADLARIRDALGELAEAALGEGALLSYDDAVAYAQRGRGQRRRPSAGWSSLTPTELEVVRLVADGLTNKDIAARLFVSRNTVKTHLAHVFAKLGMSTRAEVAAEATRRRV